MTKDDILESLQELHDHKNILLEEKLEELGRVQDRIAQLKRDIAGLEDEMTTINDTMPDEDDEDVGSGPSDYALRMEERRQMGFTNF